MKFLEVAKEGNCIRQKSWSKNNFIEVKNNMFYNPNNSILEYVANTDKTDWEIYDNSVILGSLSRGTKFTQQLNNKYVYTIVVPDVKIRGIYDIDVVFVLSPDNYIYTFDKNLKVYIVE